MTGLGSGLEFEHACPKLLGLRPEGFGRSAPCKASALVEEKKGADSQLRGLAVFAPGRRLVAAGILDATPSRSVDLSTGTKANGEIGSPHDAEQQHRHRQPDQLRPPRLRLTSIQ